MRQGKDRLSLYPAKQSYLPMARSLQAPYVRFFAASPTRPERGLYYKDQPYALD